MSYLGRSAKLSLKAQEKVSFLATAGQTVKTGLSYTPTFVEVYVNGVLLTDTTDFTATNGNSITFTVALLLNDEVTVISLKTFSVADHYNKTEADTLLAAKLPLAGGTMTGDTAHGDNVKAKFGTGNDLNIYHDGSDSYIKDDGTGSLWVASNEFRVANAGVTENMIIATENAAVKLYHNNALKLETTATGVAVTGGVALGGTGAANTLDDYEEGSWTPVVVGGITINNGTPTWIGAYTKIGNKVFYTLSASGTFNATFSASAEFSGLPFSVETIDSGLIHDPSGGEKSITEVYANEHIYILDALGSSISQLISSSGSYTTT